MEENVESVAEKLKELFHLYATLYATSCFDPDRSRTRINFYLMHVVTSTMAMRQIIPHLKSSEALKLLRNHLSVSLLYYVAIGRPVLNEDLLRRHLENRVEGIHNWEEVVELTFKQEDLHVAKVVRALKTADEMYGSEPDSIFFAAAIITADHFTNKKGTWSMKGIRFEEAWPG
eukprot:TRINITY_DN7706_c0_g1_i1.p1 TRINITY_DN7706_c0_g1~~TRINITY_DN7706_c0_g1_i1.p1  ORF type:complete len:182 (+),score=44.83 TRINITY_DN7706_c0_g1_i1:25-546(+)